jgi:DNA-binding transcriptional MerR regulator
VASGDLTIDDLARAAGTRSSTVRMYQTKGLLPPPEIRGRVGYYGPAHLARLRVIERLQQRGYSLAAIRELLENWSQGASLAAVIDPEASLGPPPVPPLGEPGELTLDDFQALFPDGAPDPEVVARAVGLGLVSIDGEGGVVHVPSRAFVEIGRELAARGVPPSRSLDEFEQLADDTRRIAERFVTLFTEYVVGAPDVRDEAAAAATIARYRFLAATAVQELVARALTDLTATALPQSSPVSK